MSFSDGEKVRIRHHMGYLNVSEASTFHLGVPAASETQFLIETAMDRVLPEAENLVRNLLATMDTIESQMVGDLELLAVRKVDEIEIAPDEMQKLKREYSYWQKTLSNILAIPVNPNDQRRQGINVRVR